MVYRTKLYIAADWDTDKNAVEILHTWNDSEFWNLNFHDAHDITSARDSSLYCSVKQSLKTRMDASKTFVLIVGNNTNSVTKGSCSYCRSYNKHTQSCARGYSIDQRSYIEYECEKAVEAGIKIVVLYKSTKVERFKCPKQVKNLGNHAPMWYWHTDGKLYWDYKSVRDAINR